MKSTSWAFEFGDVARDRVSGFKGEVIGRSDYSTGCKQICVQPSAKEDGDWRDGKWFDEERLELVGVGRGIAAEASPRTAPIGGPQQTPPLSRR